MNRNRAAEVALARNSAGAMRHRLTPRGGARNDAHEWMDRYDARAARMCLRLRAWLKEVEEGERIQLALARLLREEPEMDRPSRRYSAVFDDGLTTLSE